MDAVTLALAKKHTDQLALNVKSFGAKGDGANNDTAAIEAAISKINAVDGGSLYFPPGIYMVDNIELCSNILVFGHRDTSIIKLNADVQGNCLSINGINNVQIRDITLDGNKENNESTGQSKDSHWNGIIIRGGSSNVFIDNIISCNNGYHGIIMVNASGVRVTNSKFIGNGFRPIHGHATVYNCEVSFNECSDNGKGFAGDSSSYDGIFFFDNVQHLLIHGNRVLSANAAACIIVGGTITSWGTEQGSKHITVSDNICTSDNPVNVHGIRVEGNDLEYVHVANNIIYNCRYGILNTLSVATTNLGKKIIS